MEVYKYHSNITQKRHGASRNYRYVLDVSVAAPGKPVAGKKPKNGPKPETECFYCKGKGH